MKPAFHWRCLEDEYLYPLQVYSGVNLQRPGSKP